VVESELGQVKLKGRKRQRNLERPAKKRRTEKTTASKKQRASL
jgi:hypothetical protein